MIFFYYCFICLSIHTIFGMILWIGVDSFSYETDFISKNYIQWNRKIPANKRLIVIFLLGPPAWGSVVIRKFTKWTEQETVENKGEK